MKRVTVLLADDHAFVRKGFRSLLEIEGKVEVTGEARNGRQAVQLARKLRPAVVLMDIAMPELNGFEAARQILKAVPATRVLFLSAHDDDAYVDQVIALGASGYLIKQSAAGILSAAILEVEKGNTFFSPSISTRLADRDRMPPGHEGPLKKRKVKRSPGEAKALKLLAEGKAKKQLAADIAIRVKSLE